MIDLYSAMMGTSPISDRLFLIASIIALVLLIAGMIYIFWKTNGHK